MKSTRWN